MKYGAGKPIAIVIDGDADFASIAVRDKGIGISRADQAHIFDRFERGSGAAGLPGFGLGLWIARALLRDLGGTIRKGDVGGPVSSVLLASARQ